MNIEFILEFNQIKERLCERAVSEQAQQLLSKLKPILNEAECKIRMNETTQARTLLDTYGTPPLSPMKDLPAILRSVEQHSLLLPEQLIAVSSFITTCERLTNYLGKAEVSNFDLAYYGRSFVDVSDVKEEILNVIRGNTVDDSASNELKSIRKKIEHTNVKIREKLENLLKTKRDWFTDSYVSVRNGHYVLPVKKEYKHQIKGVTLDVSSTGNTCFMEPAAVTKLIEELTLLQIAEDNEVHKILYLLTGMVEDILPSLKLNMEAMITLDVIFSKAKLSSDMKASPVELTTERKIVICQGRHPLLNPANCVPLDFTIGGGIRGVVITGPNTGGKTVALKTVGLLSMMAQSGLHVPVGGPSTFSLHNAILCDIGDGQSISENLSTFSSHITNIISILDQTTEESLILLDELGSGTDPAEGMGIAISILEELKNRNCLFVATTHYPEIKEYALTNEGIINARMTFDRESLRPNYRLEIGEAGESCALYIAKRLGFPPHMLEIAQQAAYSGVKPGMTSSISSSPSLPSSTMPLMSLQSEVNVATQPISPSSKPTVVVSKVQKAKDTKPANQKQQILSKRAKFQIGDSVYVYPQKELGLIYQTVNEKGELGVQIKGRKQLVSYKRLKLHVSASELYPENYDFSILFETVENRKHRHKLGKGYQGDMTVDYEANQNLSKYKNKI